MSVTARLCQNLITAGRISNMQEKLDKYLAFDSITIEEYDELVRLLQAEIV